MKVKQKTMKQHLRKHFITIFGDKLQLIASHAERQRREINDQINVELGNNVNFFRSIKILLLGPESARFEVLNRFRVMFGKPFSDAERCEAKVAVLRRAILTMKCLLELLEGLSIAYEQKPTISTAMLDDEEIDILRAIQRLWNDPLFQMRLNESTECSSLLKQVI